MPKCNVLLTTLARQDIDRITDYHLLMVGPQSAERITDKLLDTIALLEDNPFLGAPHPDPVLAKSEFRKLLSGDYVCVYKVIEDTVYIHRIVNGRMDYSKLLR